MSIVVTAVRAAVLPSSTALLRATLQHAGFAPALADAVLRDGRGKPQLPAPLQFSISHCEGLALCALSAAWPLGVDAEALGPLRAEAFRIYLTAAERDWAGGDAARFYAVWTRKEAVAKAAGQGLEALPALEASAAGVDFAGRRWRLQRLPVGAAHCAHLAAPDGAPEATLHWLDSAAAAPS